MIYLCREILNYSSTIVGMASRRIFVSRNILNYSTIVGMASTVHRRVYSDGGEPQLFVPGSTRITINAIVRSISCHIDPTCNVTYGT